MSTSQACRGLIPDHLYTLNTFGRSEPQVSLSGVSKVLKILVPRGGLHEAIGFKDILRSGNLILLGLSRGIPWRSFPLGRPSASAALVMFKQSRIASVAVRIAKTHMISSKTRSAATWAA
jgi:hypothetical protein